MRSTRPRKHKPLIILAVAFFGIIGLLQSPPESTAVKPTETHRLQTPSVTVRPAVTNKPQPTANSQTTATHTPHLTPQPTLKPNPTVDTSAYRTLSTGDSGDSVLSLKKQLAMLGYFGTGTSFSNIYTENTTQGIKRFQSDQGLPQTGIADPLTQYYLYGGADAVSRQLFPTASSATASLASKPTVKATSKATATIRITPKPTAANTYTITQTYIGNRNTYKCHYPSCSSVDQMKESNKVSLPSRDAAINRGYIPCKRCNP